MTRYGRDRRRWKRRVVLPETWTFKGSYDPKVAPIRHYMLTLIVPAHNRKSWQRGTG